MSEEDFFMTEEEHAIALKKFKENVSKGMCDFCGLWAKNGHTDWCKKTEEIRC